MTDLRAEFLLRPDVVFLNHGSFGACPRPVFAEYQRLQRELEAEPVDFLHTGRTLPGRLAAARAELAAFLGARRDDLVFVPNATWGGNVVARSLRLQPGDEVLTTDHEYGAMERAWTFACERAGASLVRARLPMPLVDPGQAVEAVWRAVTPRTRVLMLSHITSPTALVLPVAELVRRAAERGILSFIDGAHAPGQIPLGLDELGADFYTGNCHKWLLSPKGAGFLHVRRDRQDLVEPLAVSWGWRVDQPGPSRFVDEHDWTGTRDPSACLAVPAALAFRRGHDWDQVSAWCRELTVAARELLVAALGTEAPCPPRPWLAQMASVPLPAVDAARLGTALRERHRIEVPITMLNGRPWLRVSLQAYNSLRDIELLVMALRAEL
ncbi:MAG: aminotransferase class V-fold PLP-dependent enzyme [bacterium]|nr:aminotransferase class V-fold PLP-dependent enzyme [bacterium]